MRTRSQKRFSVLQWDHILVALAEGSDALQSAFRLRQQPDWAQTVDGVAVLREVPAASLASGSFGDDVVGRRRRWRNPVRPLQRD